MQSSKTTFLLVRCWPNHVRPLIVRIHSGTMICQIDNLMDFRDCSFYDRFNALFKREVGGSASLASAKESQIKNVTLNIHHSDRTAVLSDPRIDVCVNQILDFFPG